MAYPTTRMRRLRSEKMRKIVRESHLSTEQLIQPIFIDENLNEKREIPSMPGQYRFPIEGVVEEIAECIALGVGGVLLFGIPATKDETGTSAWDEEGVIQKAIRKIREELGEAPLIITDVCLCEYTNHGHCGVVKDGDVLNDPTLEILKKVAVSHAEAGTDVVAPSGMMDGMVGAIRESLDKAGFEMLPILSYAAKYASSLYSPFRDAADSGFKFGDRRTYQMDVANVEEALREVELDIEEGADIVMVKPAMGYLDVLRLVKDTFRVPTAAYNVSGEYSMLMAAADRGWIDEKRVVGETLQCIRRAGADIIITYHAKQWATWYKKGILQQLKKANK